MSTLLLPASAAPFAPRSSPVVVLNSKVEPWLTATLKRTNRVKRPLNSAPQHMRCLTDTLSAATALWTLTSLMLPKAPDTELRKSSNPLVEALFNYRVIHVEAYVVHVDLVLQNEVAFKLTPESIEALIDYHKDVYSVDTANTWEWSEKETQLKRLQVEFVQAANKFVYRTNALALEGMEEGGAGEVPCGCSEEVKEAIMGLFLPLLPPPPPPWTDKVIQPDPFLPNSPNPVEPRWAQPTVLSPNLAPVDQRKMVASTPDTTSASDLEASIWFSSTLYDLEQTNLQVLSYGRPYCTMDSYDSAPMPVAPMSPLPMPRLLAQRSATVQ